MQIYRGKDTEIYTVVTKDGVRAEKRRGRAVQQMAYYSERDASAVAGCIDEATAWQLLTDISAEIEKKNTPVLPEHILIDGNRFVLAEWSISRDSRFEAPEGYEPRWALAATAFYLFLGCRVFQGLGGVAQTATAPVPVLRRELPELSEIISRCLSFSADKRPSLEEIKVIALSNLKRCMAVAEQQPPLKPSASATIDIDEIDKYWPEEMV